MDAATRRAIAARQEGIADSQRLIAALGRAGGEALEVSSGEAVQIVATLDELRAAHGALAPLFA